MHYVPAEVLYDDFRLLLKVVRMQTHELRQGFSSLLLRERRVVLYLFDQLEVDLVGRVVPHHVEDEALFDRLPHAVDVEGFGLAGRAFAPKGLKRLALRRGGERKEADVRLASSRLHHLVQAVFPVGFLSVFAFDGVLRGAAENRLQFPRRLACLA